MSGGSGTSQTLWRLRREIPPAEAGHTPFRRLPTHDEPWGDLVKAARWQRWTVAARATSASATGVVFGHACPPERGAVATSPNQKPAIPRLHRRGLGFADDSHTATPARIVVSYPFFIA